MFSNIPPDYYFNKEIFNIEENKIFKDNWIFICFKNDILNHNDFITKKIGGIPIVVQNIKGEIKAFMNVCSHRFSTIQMNEKGNRPLLCPYHGWSFNKEGKPNGIPKKSLFKNFTEEEISCKLKLKEYKLEQCGNLYFIHINEPKISLKEYLGKYYDELVLMSKNNFELIDVNKINIKANWKIIVENTLESYHVAMVHTDTFLKLGAKGLEFEFDKNHSSWDAELNLKEDDSKLTKIHKYFKNRPFKPSGYKHILIYPNLLVSTSYGISSNFSVIQPINSNETSFTSYVFLSSYEDSNPITEIYKQSLIDFNKKVFDEDQIICEEVQKGVIVTTNPGVLSLEEERVHKFQEIYINQCQK